MNKIEYQIPEGYEARIEGNKIILEPKESEDERIRKALISILKSDFEKDTTIYDISVSDIIAWLERQGSQNLANSAKTCKDEPKFKVGDKIIEKDFDECGCGTIMDIKDGKYIFDNGGFINIEEQGLWQLVEQNPTWNEEDKERCISCLQRLSTGDPAQPETINSKWFKERIYPLIFENLSGEQNSTWSEEDEKRFESTLHRMEIVGNGRAFGQLKDDITWLKSIKERCTWKPSDEQMNALWDAIVYVEGCNSNFKGNGSVLENLYNDLKKLKR